MAPWLLVFAAAFVAALPPLHEMDFAQHLATGEWIVRHHAVPFTEPFAWTRAGQPYFAYSWLAQITFYLLLRAFGPLALHLLEGALIGGSVAATYWAARQFGWQRAASMLTAVLALALAWGVANTLRPQQFLFVAIPLAWGLAARIERDGINVVRLAMLAAVGALAANTHLFFPITAAPLLYFALTDGRMRRWLPAGGALLAGWLLNPYVLVLPQLFALNFGHNLLLSRPPSVAEFVPGFEYAVHRPGVMIAVIALLALPWIGFPQLRTTRQRLAVALFWVGGLVLFAYAGRLVIIWWALAFPLIGVGLQHFETLQSSVLRTPVRYAAQSGLALAIFATAAPPFSPVFWLFEGDTVHRMLPRAGEDPALWLPSYLLCHTRPGATGKVFTEFNYGSELNWRLPGYSPSIDGRTIFPDSDAVEFAFANYGRRRVHASTWTHADLALLDRSFWLAPVLDQSPDWVLIAETRPTSWGGFAGLWAKREWWARWGTPASLPVRAVRVGDPRATCAVTGVFPKP